MLKNIDRAIPNLLILMGPTASGKTAVACEIAKLLPVELISCDSMQVYKGMPILTQVPTAAEKKRLKAHLVSFLEPSKMYDAACFRKDAARLIQEIIQRKRTPLISGGTGLYLRALLDGLFDSGKDSSRSERLRKKLLKEQEEHGGAFLHEKLFQIDPDSAAKIHANDHRRLVRALEVCELSGRLFSEEKKSRCGIRSQFYCPVFFLERGREDLYERVNARVDSMIKSGLVREVKRLRSKSPGLTASVALGFREISGFLEKRLTLDAATVLLKQHTRNYAKRQLSWFRHEKGVVPIQVAKNELPKPTAKKILTLWEKGKGA